MMKVWTVDYVSRIGAPHTVFVKALRTTVYPFDFAKSRGLAVHEIKRDFAAEGSGRIHIQLYHGA